MAITFVPGEPNCQSNASQCVFLKNRRILCYCSGNNLIVLDLSNNNIQTFYLPEDGTCVSVDRYSGRIAVGFGLNIWILTLDELEGDLSRAHWTETACLRLSSPCTALSWASSKELMCGSQSLSFWNIKDSSKVWEKILANPVHYMAFSPNAELVATVGEFDHLVKLWHRSSFDTDSLDFDFGYLPHPACLTALRWQQPAYAGQTVADILYTCCTDGKVRIWTLEDSSDPTDFRVKACLNIGPNCVPFFLDSAEMTIAVEASIAASRDSGSPHLSQDIERLVDLGTTAPDLIFSLDLLQQSISVYALDASSGSIEDIVLSVPVAITRGNLLSHCSTFRHNLASIDPTVRIYAYPPSADSGNSTIELLVHSSERGAIAQFNVNFAQLLGPTSQERVFALDSYFTGHVKSVQKIIRSADGNRLFTQSRFADNSLWRPWVLPSGVILHKMSSIDSEVAVEVAAICSNGDHVVTLLTTGILKLWDCREPVASCIAVFNTETNYAPLCMYFLPEGDHQHGHLVIVYSALDIRAFSISIGDRKIVSLGNFPLPVSSKEEANSIHMARPVDPMGWNQTVGNVLDTYQRSVMITVSRSGSLVNWTSKVTQAHKVHWLEVSRVDCGESDIIKAQVSSTKKIAIASRNGTNQKGTKLAIWDMENSILEYEETFESSVIADLDWTSSPGNQCVLGVGFTKYVAQYCQLRYDYTNDRPSWAPLRKVDISQYTDHDIGDSIWLENGTFVVGVGNQLILQDEKVNVNDSTTRALLESRSTAQAVENRTIFDVCAVMNGPLPLYHPQLVIQLLFANKFQAVKTIFVQLLKKLRYAPILEPSSIADIPSNLDLDVGKLFERSLMSGGQSMVLSSSEDEQDEMPDLYRQVSHKLQTVSLPYLTRHQQITLATVIEALAQLHNQVSFLDANGLKFLLGHKLFRMHKGLQSSMTFRDFSWALHSDNRDDLADKVLQEGTYLWPAAKEVGLSFWASEDSFRTYFENIGRNYFTKTRDPVQCALYYLALGKKQVLVGLWKVCAGHKEQQKTLKLLSNDFDQPRYKSVAMKNAYALLSKHRYEYAAAFFLLAGRPHDAVDVIMRYLDDIALAVAVSRAYSGDKGPDLARVCEKYIIPFAGDKYDRWALSWAHWIQNDRAGSLLALAGALDKDESSSFLRQDSAQRVLYEFLRDKLRMQSRNEYKFLLRTAAIYSRMGCDWMAVDLLMTWEFKHYKEAESLRVASTKQLEQSSGTENEEEKKEQEGERGESAEPPEQPVLSEKLQQQLKPPSEQAWQEPDMSAFNFGF